MPDRATADSTPFPSFTFTGPGRIHFEWGGRRRLPEEAAQLGRRPLVVCGGSFRRSGELDRLRTGLTASGLDPIVHDAVPPEPTLADLQACMDRAAGCDSVVAVGGGSVLDVAKAAAALAGTGLTARAAFAGAPLPETGRPIIAVPTTSGTGSEVTWVTVLVDPESRRKASIRGPGLMPRLALLDPELTVGCPTSVTAQSGLDALVQAIESFTSVGANSLTAPLALEATVLAARWLETAVAEPHSRPAREAMALASLLAGTALNTSRLGLVHGLAHPLGAVTGAAHGLLCGLLMPAVARFNLSTSQDRYATLARAVGCAGPDSSVPESAERFVDWLEGLLSRLQVPNRVSAVGFQLCDLDWVTAETLPSGSTRANPRPVTQDDASTLLKQIF